MKNKKRFVNTIIIIGFLCTLYWVEFSTCGSQAIAQYNGGYGTFDMKSYDTNGVDKVLSNMENEGLRRYYQYYFGDYLFILFFGLTQAIVSKNVCSKDGILKHMLVYRIGIGAILIRGIADFLENTLLLVTLIRYPSINGLVITSASICTQVKLCCIMVWIGSMIIGILKKIYTFIRK